ncbi:MAG: hypothetical protein O2840_02530 [bacterium]|nr:hypothetical protein [bacterium]
MQDPAAQTTPNSYVDAYQPPSDSIPPAPFQSQADPVAQPPADIPVAASAASDSQALEDQNIFELLGVSDGTDQEKEAFLLELQRVLWDDFLQYDVQLLITKEEFTQLQTVRDSKTTPEEKEEAVVVYLEKLIPDLEDIMLEKALELKGDMVRERITGLRELYVNDPGKIAQLDTATSQVEAGSWRSAATTLNAIATS